MTPSLEDGGAVVFTDAAGEVQGYIPPGFMVDSNVHPRRGEGEVSFGVSYELVQDGDAWALRIRVSISPRGSLNAILVPPSSSASRLEPYQLALTKPGICPVEPSSRSAMRDSFSLR